MSMTSSPIAMLASPLPKRPGQDRGQGDQEVWSGDRTKPGQPDTGRAARAAALAGGVLRWRHRQDRKEPAI
jgi:hypothetical protein